MLYNKGNHMTLYISDLDGTLLNTDARLSAYSRETLNELIDAGLLFTVASARSVHSLQPTIKGLRLQLPVIEFNGSFISDLESGRHLTSNTMSWKTGDTIIHIAADMDLHPFYSTICCEGEDRLYTPEIMNEGGRLYQLDRIEHTDPRLQEKPFVRTDRKKNELVCLTFIGPEKRLKQLEDELKSLSCADRSFAVNFFENVYSPGWLWLTVHSSEARKHLAIRKLRERYCPQADELVVFGDNGNDLSMFQDADRSYAVANAVEELKAEASGIIAAHSDDAVVRHILSEIRKEGND